MLAKVRSAFEARDLGELAQQFDQIVVLREAVLAYLQHIGRSELSDSEAEEHARLVAATGEIESMSAAISRELGAAGRRPSTRRRLPRRRRRRNCWIVCCRPFRRQLNPHCVHWWRGTSKQRRRLSRSASRYWTSRPICKDSRPRAWPRTTRIASRSIACSSRCSTDSGASTVCPSTWQFPCCHGAFSLESSTRSLCRCADADSGTWLCAAPPAQMSRMASIAPSSIASQSRA